MHMSTACVCMSVILGMVKFLVFAMRETIRRISLDVPYYADIVLPITGLQNAVALDVDPKTGWYGWELSGLPNGCVNG